MLAKDVWRQLHSHLEFSLKKTYYIGNFFLEKNVFDIIYCKLTTEPDLMVLYAGLKCFIFQKV
jgi:hypothetical protein